MRHDGLDKMPLWPWCQGACDDVKLQLPWPFKPLHSLGQQVFTSWQDQFSDQGTKFSKGSTRIRVSDSEPRLLRANLTARFGQWMQKKEQYGSRRLSAEEQGDAEERALAIALAGKQKATLLEFYSPRCTLCQSLLKVIADVERREGDWLRIVMADVENKKWLPEVCALSLFSMPKNVYQGSRFV